MSNFKDYTGLIKCILAFALVLVSTYAYSQSSDIEFYQFDQAYKLNETRLFKGVEVLPLWAYPDSIGTYKAEEMMTESNQLPWMSADQITPKRDITYWLHTRLAGNEGFKGRHVFQVSQELGNDLHAYQNIDIYTINQVGEKTNQHTGNQVKPKDKPINFWGNLITIELEKSDTIDIYIRLSGFNLSYQPEALKLWHIDFDDLFDQQIYLAKKSSFFYGILGIQVLFFVFLYLIERENIYIYFSLFGTGLFLSRAFSEFNFSSFVPIPSLINYNEVIFHLSVFLTVAGGIYFVAHYLNVDKKRLVMRRVAPIYLFITLIAFLRFIFRFHFSEEGSYPVLLTPAVYTLSSLFFPLNMSFTTSSAGKRSKVLLFISILPIVVGTILTITYNEDLLPLFVNAQIVDDIMKVAVIFLVITLAMTVGYRSKALKNEKNAVIEENLKAQQIIFEEKMKADKLEEMDDLKTRLYTNITHEFRTPLTVIMGINNELMETNQKLSIPKSKKEKINSNQELIQRNSQNLLNLVNQLLDLSKSESKNLELNLVQRDIIKYLNYLTESFFSKAKEKNIRLVFYTELSELVMDYDEQKIQHIIYNLLSNALKFTQSNGKIILHASTEIEDDRPSLIMKIVDDGIGISEEKTPFIFDRFYQVDDSNTRQGDGSGIGLSLTKELINLMNGSISVQSQEYKGSTFTVVIPISNEAELKEDKIHESESYNNNEGIASISKDDVETTDDTTHDQPIIQVVEDNRDVFLYLKQVLSSSYHIINANNGEDGIRLALEQTPDLIISDVMMPKKDGYELTEALKKDTRTSHIPIILLTAKANVGDKIKGLDKGADAYMSKPFDKKELLTRIKQLLDLRLRLREHYLLTIDDTEEPTDIPLSAAQIRHEPEELFLTSIRDVITENIENENMNAAFLAEKKDISPSQLYRKLKALTGSTPNKFIRDIRLKKSLSFLKDDDLNIAEVAYKVGFSSPSYFTRAFHNKYGMSPLLYKKDTLS